MNNVVRCRKFLWCLVFVLLLCFFKAPEARAQEVVDRTIATVTRAPRFRAEILRPIHSRPKPAAAAARAIF